MTRFKSPINALYKEFVMKFHTKPGVCTAFTMFMLMLIPLALPGNAIAATGTVASCTDCHGYPPADSATRNTGTGAFAGNHSTHFSVNNCQACHNTVGASEYSHSLKSSVAGVNYINMTGVIHNSRMGAAAKYNKGVSFPQSATPTLSTCSNVNCHFETVTPTWGQTTTWSSTKTAGNNDANCAQCHASTGLTSGNHAKHITAGGGTQTACAKCHPDYNAMAGAAAFLHASSGKAPIALTFAAAPNLGGTYTGGRTGSNFLPSAGISATGSCSSTYCHSPGTLSSGYAAPKVAATWGNTLTCAGCHDSNTATTTLTAKHLKHVGGTGSNYNINCRKCHAATVSNSMTIATVANHVNKNVNIAFQNLSGAVSGTYIGAATPYTRAASAVPANAYCSNTYCHSQGRSGSNYSAAVYKTMSTPSWTAAFVLPGGVRACSACHGGDSTNNSIQRQITSVAHRRHVGGTASSMYNIGCAVCHSLTASTNTTINQTAKHANFQKNVDISATYGGTYSANNTLPGSAVGTCSSVYCHSDGKATPGYTTISWNAAAPSCTGCHGNATTNSPAATALSGKHSAHVNNAAFFGAGNSLHCVECHSTTVSNDTTLNATTGTTVHANKLMNYTGVRAGKPYVTTTKVCSNVYCHSSGQAIPVFRSMTGSKAWGGSATLGCNGCHGYGSGAFASNYGEPNYSNVSSATRNTFNSHQAHVKNNIASCNICHATTVNTSAGLLANANHMDKTITVAFDGIKATSGTYSNGYCNNVSCHGGTGSVRWGTSGLTCASCHGTLSTGAHAKHTGAYLARGLTAYLNMTANISPSSGDTNATTLANYGFGCSICHPLLNTNHANGTVDLELNSVAGGGTMRSKTTTWTRNATTGLTTDCANAYCHSNGKGAYLATGAWNTPYTVSNRCTKCHGNSPNDVAHNAHKAGIHNDTLSQKTTNGLIAASGAPGVVSGHGDPAYSTTISCNICHNGTVTTSGNKYKTDCLACHSGTADTATNGGAIYLSNLRNHVNGSVNVQFAAVTIKTRAQLRPESYGNYTGNATTNGWVRNAGNYKTGLAAYESSKRVLNAGTAGFAGETCSNIVCHNGQGNSNPRWVTDRGAGCLLCHSKL